MRRVIRLIAIVCCGLVALDAGPAQAEKRVALVNGNSAYRAVAELPNPRKDARDVAAALRGVDFAEVMERYDLGVRDMRQALSAFRGVAPPARTGRLSTRPGTTSRWTGIKERDAFDVKIVD